MIPNTTSRGANRDSSPLAWMMYGSSVCGMGKFLVCCARKMPWTSQPGERLLPVSRLKLAAPLQEPGIPRHWMCTNLWVNSIYNRECFGPLREKYAVDSAGRRVLASTSRQLGPAAPRPAPEILRHRVCIRCVSRGLKQAEMSTLTCAAANVRAVICLFAFPDKSVDNAVYRHKGRQEMAHFRSPTVTSATIWCCRFLGGFLRRS